MTLISEINRDDVGFPALLPEQERAIDKYVSLVAERVIQEGELPQGEKKAALQHYLSLLVMGPDKRSATRMMDLPPNWQTVMTIFRTCEMAPGLNTMTPQIWEQSRPEDKTSLTQEEWNQLHSEISAKRYAWHLEALESGKPVFIQSDENLPRSLIATEDGEIYVLLNKTSKGGDLLIGHGKSKKAKYAINFDRGTVHAFVTEIIYDSTLEDAEKEDAILEGLKDSNYVITPALTLYRKMDDEGRIKHQTIGPLMRTKLTSNLHQKSPDEVIAYAKSALRALDDLHTNQKRAHCDIKPDNLGDEPFSMIDFGSSIKEGEEVKFVDGTLAYMSPDLVRSINDNKEIDFEMLVKNDMFSLGVVLFQMTFQEELPWFDIECGYFHGYAEQRLERDASKSLQWMTPYFEREDVPLKLLLVIQGLLNPNNAPRMSAEDAMRVLSSAD